ncbi:MAG: hypothetical protein OXP70_09705 [Acidobacteriota bacterium]|nr:hypothetical protein [Acidobacteriota bacterium]
MKVALLGGGGLRAPLLAGALAESGLGVDELVLYDTDRERLGAIAPVVEASAPGVRVRVSGTAASAVRDSRFVFAAIRAGGQEARAHDERVCTEAGVLGQETVGAAGAALAMRNIPAMLRLARVVERESPDATLINYTNPAGMVTEALLNETSLEVVGICDTPAELADRVVKLLYLDPAACSVSWSGINHLGWLTALEEADPTGAFPPENRLEDLFGDPDRLLRIHRDGLFESSEMARAIPSEYVFLHLHPNRAMERTRASGTTRGAAILNLEQALFAGLAAAAGDAQRAHSKYRQFVGERDATYFQIESRGDAGQALGVRPTTGPTGYDRIGLEAVRALLGNEPQEMVVNTWNRTPLGGPAVPELPADDVVEVACLANRHGVAPIPQPPLPAGARDLVRRVKAAEREFVRAALAGDPRIAAEALIEHPAGGPEAARIFDQLRTVAEEV